MFHLFILSKKELVVMPTSSFCILANKVNAISLLSSEGFIVPSERNFVLTCNNTAHFFVLSYFKI
ncbi:hypothetical protein CBR59_29105 [Bacillus thuringiensis]|nr:hypothetical protein CBP87_29440 [Bacillus thuringiensis]PNK47254.1 hypothetical protein CBR59_29105 [Bacillus thuringiensis]